MPACVCAVMQEAAAAMLHETSTTGGSTTGPAGSGSASLMSTSSLADEPVACSDHATDAASLGARPGITPCLSPPSFVATLSYARLSGSHVCDMLHRRWRCGNELGSNELGSDY